MKKILKLLTLMIAVLLLVTACGNETIPEPEPVEEETVEETIADSDDFYTEYTESTTRPIAVMIDNDNKDAWPHAGLSDAYLIYEITVEGSATRLIAFFNNTDTGKIGPVRSSRHYFLDYVLENDAIYTHFGWSPRAMSDIPALGVNNINGIYDADTFWRENKYAGDYHSAFTSMDLIKKAIEAKGYRTEREKAPLNFAPQTYVPEGKDALSLTIPYAGFYTVDYKYDEESKTYKRFLNGNEEELQEDASIAAKNIVVIYMNEAPLGDGSPRIDISDVGTGQGYFISEGKYIDITWEKPARDEKTTFKDEAGGEILLNPGQTWIQIVPSNKTVQIGG